MICFLSEVGHCQLVSYHCVVDVEQSSKSYVRKNSRSYTLNQKGNLKMQFQMLSPSCMVIPKLTALP